MVNSQKDSYPNHHLPKYFVSTTIFIDYFLRLSLLNRTWQEDLLSRIEKKRIDDEEESKRRKKVGRALLLRDRISYEKVNGVPFVPFSLLFLSEDQGTKKERESSKMRGN